MARAEELGATVEMIELDLVSIELAFLVVLESALAAQLSPHLERFRDRLDPSLVTTVEKGLRHSAVALQAAAFSRTSCSRKVQAVLEHHDVVASPTLSAPPLPIDQEPHGRVSIAGRDAGSIRGPKRTCPPSTSPATLPCRSPVAGLTAACQSHCNLSGASTKTHSSSVLPGSSSSTCRKPGPAGSRRRS